MKLERLVLENFGPHELLEFSPGPGLTGVVGPNGSGKSSILDAAELLLTGSAPRAGGKDENVRAGTDPKQPSRVSGVITHNGMSLDICRDLRSTRKSSVRIDGGEPILGEARVAAALAEVFGARMGLLADYVFIKQGDLFGFVDASPGRRAEVFAQLFGTRHAQRLHEKLGKAISALPAAGSALELDEARREAADARGALSSVAVALQGYADLKAYNRAADPDAAVLERRAAYLRAREAAKEAELLHAELAARADAIEEQASAAASFADVVEARHASLLPAAEDARGRLASAKADEARRDADLARASRRQKLGRDASDHPKPPRPDPPDLELAGTIAEMAAQRAADAKLLTSVGDGAAACPTCGTPASSLAEKVAAAAMREAFHAEEMPRLQGLLSGARRQQVARDRWKAWREAHRAATEALDAEDAAAPPPEDDRVDLQALRATIRDAGQAITAVAAARRDLDAASYAARSHREQTAKALEAVAAATARRKALKVTKEQADAAEAALGAVGARLHARGELVGRKKALAEALKLVQVRLDRLEALAASNADREALAAHLGMLRGLMHRDALPRDVALGYLSTLEADVNESLANCDAGFRVETRDDLGYDAIFEDGRGRQPAQRISGGQKVLLALAFWPALNALFAADFGLICLDEPTLFLDDRNVDLVAKAFEKMKTTVAARGLQALLVTHEPRLGRLFDGVLSLAAAGPTE